MKIRPALILAAALCVCACSKHPVPPRFTTMALDTLLCRNGSSCQVDYRFLSIENAAKSPALELIEQANIGYFFQLEEFSGTAGEGAAAFLNDILNSWLPEANAPAGGRYEISV